jgi:hypothetical protein
LSGWVHACVRDERRGYRISPMTLATIANHEENETPLVSQLTHLPHPISTVHSSPFPTNKHTLSHTYTHTHSSHPIPPPPPHTHTQTTQKGSTPSGARSRCRTCGWWRKCCGSTTPPLYRWGTLRDWTPWRTNSRGCPCSSCASTAPPTWMRWVCRCVDGWVDGWGEVVFVVLWLWMWVEAWVGWVGPFGFCPVPFASNRPTNQPTNQPTNSTTSPHPTNQRWGR